MGNVITGILTDTSLRSPLAVGTALMSEAELAAPWASLADQ
jgi:hypothetical protein